MDFNISNEVTILDQTNEVEHITEQTNEEYYLLNLPPKLNIEAMYISNTKEKINLILREIEH